VTSDPAIQRTPLGCSVIVCTFNRAESLQQTLQALSHQQVESGLEWEVIVVDNCSTDSTQAVVKEVQRAWPLLRYAYEGQQGLSHARNLGINQAHGEVLLFTDDDVLPEITWVQTVLKGMRRYAADACGGFIGPIWEVPPPSWLTTRFHGFLAIRADRTDDYEIMSGIDAPFGANMAVRRAVLDQVGKFDVTRGRVGAVLSSGEDGELFERILAAGFRVMFLGQARVHHRIEAWRVTKRYLRRWRFQTSQNLARCYEAPGKRIFGIPRFMYRQMLVAVCRAVIGHFACTADEAFNRELVIMHFLGLMSGLSRREMDTRT